MKKTVTIILLALTLMCGGGMMNAQKKKSSGKAKTSATISKTEDGYPNIVGHTYRYTISGARMDFKFNSNNVTITIAEGKQSASDNCPYTYKKGYVKIYDPEVPDPPMFDGELSGDGKSILLSSGYTMKLVR